MGIANVRNAIKQAAHRFTAGKRAKPTVYPEEIRLQQATDDDACENVSIKPLADFPENQRPNPPTKFDPTKIWDLEAERRRLRDVQNMKSSPENGENTLATTE